jgi:hypothetical protein
MVTGYLCHKSKPDVWGETALVFVMKRMYQHMTIGVRMPVKQLTTIL